MKILTGTCAGEKFEKIKRYGLGIMVSPSPTFKPRRNFSQVVCALDNGAFQLHLKGIPFLEKPFWETLEICNKLGIKLDFIVCPDIIAGGRRSLDFSFEWASQKLHGSQNLALAIQDGVEEKDVDSHLLSFFSYLFIGGTVEWKWKNADRWIKFAHKHGKKCHIGRVGQARYMKFANHLKADSIDSTSPIRNDKNKTGELKVIEEYLGKELFE